MTELELIIDLHENSERQGPGSEKDTLKALGFLNLPTDQKLKVVDIGCGSGGQTITLAKTLNGQITAVDLFPEFLPAIAAFVEQPVPYRRSGKQGPVRSFNWSMGFGTARDPGNWSREAIGKA